MPQDLAYNPGVGGLDKSLTGLRIIIMLGPLVLGGSERQALLLARYLNEEQGAEVQIWGIAGGYVTTLCDQYGIQWRIVQSPWEGRRFGLLKNLLRLAWQLRSARPDVILPYMYLPSFACTFVWRLTGARLCIWNQRDHGLTRYITTTHEPRAVRNTPIFVANSQYIADYLRHELGADPQRIRIVHNGVNLPPPEADRETWRNRLEVGNEAFLACMVANLHQDKDHVTLLKSWRAVLDHAAKTDPKPILLLAGRFDNTHNALKALADDLKLGDRIRFLGAVTDVAGLLEAVDLGVFSSRSEGSPNGVLESMASGLAMVCTDIPPLREAMPEEQYPFLVPTGDNEAMAQAVLELIARPELRKVLGDVNRRRVLSCFSKQQMCEEMLRIIVDAFKGDPGAHRPRLIRR